MNLRTAIVIFLFFFSFSLYAASCPKCGKTLPQGSTICFSCFRSTLPPPPALRLPHSTICSRCNKRAIGAHVCQIKPVDRGIKKSFQLWFEMLSAMSRGKKAAAGMLFVVVAVFLFYDYPIIGILFSVVSLLCYYFYRKKKKAQNKSDENEQLNTNGQGRGMFYFWGMKDKKKRIVEFLIVLGAGVITLIVFLVIISMSIS